MKTSYDGARQRARFARFFPTPPSVADITRSLKNPTAQALMNLLTDKCFGFGKGYVDYAYARLAEILGRSTRAIARASKQLRDLGYVTVDLMRDGSYRWRVPVFAEEVKEDPRGDLALRAGSKGDTHPMTDPSCPWPERGVYFFFENGEERSDSGSGPRVVRVGTHAVASGSRSSLWGRLKQHLGGNDGAGNHRGSVFRKLVGASLAGRDPGLAVDSWGQGNTASGEIPRLERELEVRVSTLLRAMPVLWLDIDDEPSKHSLRSYIERNSIALLSNYRTDPPLDAHSPTWLGAHCPKPKIRDSHLWNSNHVDESYDPAFLEVLEQLITAQLEGGTVEGLRWPEAPAETPRKPRQVEAKTSGGGRTRGGKSHYDLITEHLQASGQTTLTATIDEVNTWTDGRLPESAYKHQAWWSNSKATYRHLGWKASPRFEESIVMFRRADVNCC